VERKGVTIKVAIVAPKQCLAVWNCSLLASMEWCELREGEEGRDNNSLFS